MVAYNKWGDFAQGLTDLVVNNIPVYGPNGVFSAWYDTAGGTGTFLKFRLSGSFASVNDAKDYFFEFQTLYGDIYAYLPYGDATTINRVYNGRVNAPAYIHVSQLNSEAYDDGYYYGYIDGVAEGWQTGYDSGYQLGELDGYNRGFADGVRDNISVGWFRQFMSGFIGILDIELLPGIRLWHLVSFPLVLGALFLFLKIIK